jgi:hypothetical protein
MRERRTEPKPSPPIRVTPTHALIHRLQQEAASCQFTKAEQTKQ